MGFAAASDPYVAVAWSVGCGALAITVALTLQVLVLRERTARRAAREARFFAIWRPLLFEAVAGEVRPLPAIAARDVTSFLLLWTQLQEGVRGDARARLNALADGVDARGLALRLLRREDAVDRLLALRALGYLGSAGDRAAVVRWLDDPRPYLSIAAARALVHIDPAGAARELLPRLAARPDWPVSLLATVLADAGRTGLSGAVAAVLPGAEPAALVRLLPLVSALAPDDAESIAAGLLASSEDPELLGAALRALRTTARLGDVRRACAHAAWSVRTQAASALGRLGGPADRELLVRLLADPQWWVRYRAAQALASGRFGSADEVTALADALHDRFARDIVAHALAERRA